MIHQLDSDRDLRWLLGNRVLSVFLAYGSVGLLSLSLYVHNLGTSVKLGYVVSEPVEFFHFVLVGLGSSVVGLYQNTPLLWTAFAVGVVLFAVYSTVFIAFFKLAVSEQRQVLGIFSLVLLGIAEELLIGVGRFPLGVIAAAGSRYATLTMISVAASLVLLAFYGAKSRIYSTVAVVLGIAISGFVVLADYSEIAMVPHRRLYGRKSKRDFAPRSDHRERDASTRVA